LQKHSRFRLSIGLAALSLCAWLGCSNDGETGSAGSIGSIEMCVRICEKQADANCATSPDRATCSSRCSEIAADAQCRSAYFAFTPCGATEATYTCDTSGSLEMNGCWAEAQPYIVCSACQVTAASDACERCYAESCCAEHKAYWGSPGLDRFFECLAACVQRDAGSQCECGMLYPTVPPALEAMLSCNLNRCGAVCS
jgi:hypothetical protein